jgi:probable phosphoglycerate mutase
MLFFYIRHGDPIYHPDELTPKGRREAEAIGKRLALFGLDKIYSSTSNRAYETALPAAEMLKKEIVQLDFAHESQAFKEFSTLDENGVKRWIKDLPQYKKLFASDEIHALGKNWFDHPELADLPGLKVGIERIRAEADKFMLSLGYEHDRTTNTYRAVAHTKDRVALFAHAGFGSAFLPEILDIPYPAFAAHSNMRTTGMTVISFEPENGSDVVIPCLLTYSSDAHLYKEGLPLFYSERVLF